MPIVFTSPVVLLALGTAALPWIIHLVLRPKPRVVTFPALAFLAPALVAGRSASRLRNLLLLLLRALMLVLIVLLLAGPAWPVGGRAGPVRRVVVFDDSLSTEYRHGDSSVADITAAAAMECLRMGAADEHASSASVVFTSDPGAGADWRTTAELIEKLASRRQVRHAHGLDNALRRAGEMVRSSDGPVELIVATDMAAHAWRDVRPELLGRSDLRARLVAPVQLQPANAALVVSPPARTVSSTGALEAATQVSGDFADVQGTITAYEGDRVIDTGAVRVAAPRQVASLRLAALSPGAHGIRLVLEPEDRLPFDQERFAALEVGPMPLALIYESGRVNELEVEILRNLIAPRSLNAAFKVADIETRPGTQPPPIADRRPALIVWPSAAVLDSSVTSEVRRVVEQGSHLLLVPSSGDDRPDWAGVRELLCAKPRVESGIEATVTWQAPGSAPLNIGETLAEGLEELNGLAVTRRLAFESFAPGVEVHARDQDRNPILVSKSAGAGRVWLLATSPDPAWSEFGVRAAGLLTLVHTLIALGAGPPQSAAHFEAGETTRRFPALPASGPASISSLTDPSFKTAWTRLRDGAPESGWFTDQAGLYAVRAGGKQVIYAVNWPAEESDLTRIDVQEAARRLGVSELQVVEATTAAGSRPAGLKLSDWVEPGPVVATLLLASFFAEMYVAAALGRRTQ